MEFPHVELMAEEAREELVKKGALAVPKVKVMEDASPMKVFSGKMQDGNIWILRKNVDDYFFIEYKVKGESPSWTAGA
jgi:hypothetical protein